MLDFRNFVEMPIQVKMLGNWQNDKQQGWDKPSIGLLTNPVGVQKITQKWSKLPQQFNAWMLKGTNMSKHVEIGQVTPEWITNNLKLKIVPYPQKPDEINIDPNAINVIYTQNKGVEKVPMNYWTIAHRFGHAIKADNVFKQMAESLKKDVTRILESVFGQHLKQAQWGYGLDMKSENLLMKAANALGTMGSARKGALRSFFEFPYELLAQYMLTGKVTFNRLPFKILKGYTWGKPQYINPHYMTDVQAQNEYITEMEQKYQNMLGEVVEGAVGKTFVM